MRVLYFSFFIIFADQITKLLIKGLSIPSMGLHIQGFPLNSSRPIIGDFLRLTYIENPGMAFGIDFGGRILLTFFALAASIVIIFYLYKMRYGNFFFRLSLASIFGGAVGNLIDRTFYGVIFGTAPLFYGSVVDFIDVDFFNVNIFGYQLTRWPIFNIADASVTCGVILLIITYHKSHITPTQCAQTLDKDSS